MLDFQLEPEHDIVQLWVFGQQEPLGDFRTVYGSIVPL